MKKIALTLFSLVFALTLLAQQAPPQGINYQAMVYVPYSNQQVGVNSAGQIPANTKQVVVKFTLEEGNNGPVIYEETLTDTTDQYGLLNAVIGTGTPTSNSPGLFNQINWSLGDPYLRVSITLTEYNSTVSSYQKLWSVPYALYADHANTADFATNSAHADSSDYADVAGNGITGVVDNGNGTLTFTYLDGSTYTTPVLTGLMGAQGPAGQNGQSAYDIWLTQGNTGTQQDFLNSLQGATGPQGPAGVAGAQGPQGIQGTPGSQNAWSLTGNASTSPTTNFIGTTDAQDWVIKTNNIERMRVTSAGYIGIGTSIPTSELYLDGRTSGGSVQFTIEDNNAGYHNGAILFKSSHTMPNKRGNGLFFFNEAGQNEWFFGRPYSSNFSTLPNDELVVQRLSTTAHDDVASALIDGLGNPTTTVRFLTIKSSGSMGIGTNTPDQLLSVNGNASKAGGGSWATFSDRRVKQDIKPFSDGLEVLMKLNPVIFKYNDKSGYTDLNKSFVGFIAQDVENVAPYMVNLYDDTKGPSGLSDKRQFDESALNKILVNAVKEQQSQIEELKKEMEEMKLLIKELKKD